MKILPAGSAAVALTLCAACASHATTTTANATASGPGPVKVTTNLDDVANCSAVGKVIVPDSDPDAARAARDQTAAVGGNVLLRQNELVWNGSAYHCPPSAAH